MNNLSLIKLIALLLYGLCLCSFSVSVTSVQDNRDMKETLKDNEGQSIAHDLRGDNRYKRSLQNWISNDNDNDNDNDGGESDERLNNLLESYNENDNENDLLDSRFKEISRERNIDDTKAKASLLYLALMKQLNHYMARNLNGDGQLSTRRTPRLGRSTTDANWYNTAAILAQQLHDTNSHYNYNDYNNKNDNYGNDYGLDHSNVWPRLIKKSVPFKPRLGKRAQISI